MKYKTLKHWLQREILQVPYLESIIAIIDGFHNLFVSLLRKNFAIDFL